MSARFHMLIGLLVISSALLITIVLNRYGGEDYKGDVKKPHPVEVQVGAVVPNLLMLFKPGGAEPEEFADPEITISHTCITLNGKPLPLDVNEGPTYFTAFNSKSLNMAFLTWGEETLLVLSFKQRQDLQQAVQVFKSIAAKPLPYIGHISPTGAHKDIEELIAFYEGVGFTRMIRDQDQDQDQPQLFRNEEQIFDISRPFPNPNDATIKFKHVGRGAAGPPGVVMWDKSIGMVLVMAMHEGTPLPFAPRYQKQFVFLKDFLE